MSRNSWYGPTDAVQKAIDSSHTTLYLLVSTKKQMWRIDGTVIVRAIHRITSLESRLSGKGVIRVVDGSAPQVVFGRIDLYQGDLSLEQASGRPVTFSGMIFVKGGSPAPSAKPGDGGRTEIMGGFIYAQGAEKTTPMFAAKDAHLTATVAETTWIERNFKTILEEARGGQTRRLTYDQRSHWRNHKASMLPLLGAARSARMSPQR